MGRSEQGEAKIRPSAFLYAVLLHAEQFDNISLTVLGAP